MAGILQVTDGTTTIDIKTGICRLVDWTPITPPIKGGGVWQDSMLDDGRKLTMTKRANGREVFSLRVAGADMDSTIKETQELRRLLEKARQYWTTNWQREPVWVEARGACETNTRYAYVMDYTAERDDDPYQSPFNGDVLATMDEWTLEIERSDWLNNPPGQGSCVAIASQQTYWSGSGGGNYSPGEMADDCRVEATTGIISLNTPDHIIGNAGGVPPIFYAGGIRFIGVLPPAGSTITYARIDVVAHDNEAGGVVQWKVYGELNAAPALFTTYANFIARALTTSLAIENDTTVGGWVAGNTYVLAHNTIDFRNLIQEIINLPGWVAGNNLAIIHYDAGSTDWRNYCSWDNALAAPILYLEWTTGETALRGRAATCTNEVYFANKHNMAQITNAYHNRAAAWVDIMAYAYPAGGNLLPAVPAAGDILYLGINTVTLDSGPFASAILNIGVRGDNIIDVAWEYWNGAWVNLTTVRTIDTAVPPEYFNRAGVGSVSFDPPSDWVTTAVNGVTGYWIRCRIVAVGANPVAPTQINRVPYTVVRPSVDVDELQISGDITALAKALVYDWDGYSYIKSVILATRSQSRGDNFRMYLNFADEQNISGITAIAGTNTAFAAYVEAPTGRAMLYNPGAGSTGNCQIKISTTPALIGESATAKDFFGKFRCYLRVDRESAVTDCTVQLKIGIENGNGIYTSYYYASEVKTVASLIEAYLIDFGVIDIPGFTIVNDTEILMPLVFDIELANTTATPNLYLYDLILIPIDEWAGEFTMQTLTQFAEAIGLVTDPEYNYLDVDSLDLKRKIASFVRYSENGEVMFTWKDITAAAMQLQANADQQVYCLLRKYDTGDNIWYAEVRGLGSMQLYAAARYLSMRGNR